MKKIDIKKPNNIAILTVAVIILTVVTALVFIYMPFLNKNRFLREEILREREKNILIGTIRALGKHLKVYEKRLPEEGRGVSWLLGVVSDIASKEGVEISSIKPGTPEDKGLYIKLYIIIDTVSTYQQLGEFISKIESYERFLKIENIDLKRLDMDEGFGKGVSKLKAFDVKGHIIISTVVFKE